MMLRLLTLSLQLFLLFESVSCQQNSGVKSHSKRYRPYVPLPYRAGNASAVYEPQTELCCMGQVQPKNRLETCCGKALYKPARELCCNNVVHELKIGFACCGNVTYDTEKHMCCGNNVIDFPDATNPNPECCGNTTYNPTKQKCCHVSPNVTAIVDKINKNSMCCGSKVYDSDTEVCCQEAQDTYPAGKYAVHSKVYTKSTVHSCCGSEVIDINTHGCCGSNISYNIKEQTCCYSTYPWTVVPISKPTDQCCGSSGKSFSPDTKICCGENITEKKGANLGCCGNNTYNMDDEICCWGANNTRGITKESPKHNSCCGNKSYDISNQTCCVDGNESALHPNQDDKGMYYGCCGLIAYDFSKHTCCGKELSKQTPTYEYSCCGDKLYNTNKKTCCYDFDYTTGTQNTTLIDDYKPTGFCCGGELYNEAADKGCCNNKIYHKKSEVCCGAKIISKNEKEDRNTCCYPTNKRIPPYYYREGGYQGYAVHGK